jgi:hypothetical protein
MVASLEDGQNAISEVTPLAVEGIEVETNGEGYETKKGELNMSLIIEKEVESNQENCEIVTDGVSVSLSKETEMVASLEDGQNAISEVTPLAVEDTEVVASQGQDMTVVVEMTAYVNRRESEKKLVSVLRTNNNGGKRKYDKRAYCLFCKEPQSHIVRHWETRHKHESQLLTQSSKQSQKQLIPKLRNMGNHIHNTSVLSSDARELVVT